MEKEKSTERSRRIGAHLKKLRFEHGLSQDDAAELFEINEKMWKRFEQGEYLPPTELLLKLKEVWDVDVAWLLFDDSFQHFDQRTIGKESNHKKAYYGPKGERT